MHHRRRGRDVARLFRQVRGLSDVRACSLDSILEDDQLELFELETENPGFTASLVRAAGIAGGGIALARGQDGGRRRFSIAHELGHFHIPSHSREGLGNLVRKMTSGRGA